MANIPFQAINWDTVGTEELTGEKGTSYSKTIQYEGLRIRMVDYSEGYVADHWCQKGHIAHCLQGEFVMKTDAGEKMNFSEGMSFVVSDNRSSLFSMSEKGAKLLIIDGDFLRT
jgi:quercetin dioxygenase-like cupin family protein